MTTSPPPSSSPPTLSPDELTAPVPGFRPLPPRQSPGPDPLPPNSTITPTPGPSPSGDADGDWGDEDWEGSPGPASPSTRSSPASTADEPLADLAAVEGYRELLAALFGQTVGIAALAVRWTRTRRRPLPPDIWRPDADDRRAIGEPLSRIAARHAPIAGQASNDLVDGLTAGIAATDFGMRHLELEGEVDREIAHHQDLQEADSRV